MRILIGNDSALNDVPESIIAKAKLVAEIFDDYENPPLFRSIDEKHVMKWVKQFEESDWDFLLDELLQILPHSYLSKNEVIQVLENMFDYFKEYYKHDSVEDLLDHCCFLSCQDPQKSQSILLEFLDRILSEKYETTIEKCGSKDIKYWFYIDDVLASGGTFKSNIIQLLTDFGYDDFINSEIIILSVFFFKHSWGEKNAIYSLKQDFGDKIEDRIKFFHVKEIQNNPNKNRYVGVQSFNHAYPIKENQPQEVLDYLASLEHATSNEQFAFRSNDSPENESFFSSKESRVRYENIILKKGIELINKIEKKPSIGLRPLGFTVPSHKTFGLGSHAFTWRNISNTCPLVFWWESGGWYPLLPVKNRG